MDAAFNQFRAVIAGHEFFNDPVTRKSVCRNPEHKGAWDENCWKAQATTFFVEQNQDFKAGPTDQDRVQDIVNSMEEGAMATLYILIAEGVDTQGRRAMYTSTTPEIAVWDELKLVEWGKQLIIAKMQGRNG